MQDEGSSHTDPEMAELEKEFAKDAGTLNDQLATQRALHNLEVNYNATNRPRSGSLDPVELETHEDYLERMAGLEDPIQTTGGRDGGHSMGGRGMRTETLSVNEFQLLAGIMLTSQPAPPCRQKIYHEFLQ